MYPIPMHSTWLNSVSNLPCTTWPSTLDRTYCRPSTCNCNCKLKASQSFDRLIFSPRAQLHSQLWIYSGSCLVAVRYCHKT